MAFNGCWVEYKNENLKEFLVALGIDVSKLGDLDNLKQQLTVKQEGDKFTITEKSVFRTKEISWTMGEEFMGDPADGSVMKGTYTFESPTHYVGKFKRVSDGKELVNSRQVDGDEMLQTTKIDDVELKKYFKRKEV
ncbi:fatty acid-binding protein, intestinal-like [Lepisosteus oculatus]|nr:PREDICTED: fatty acid-binding protein, intestinal-like [Lepisosteus oculatus]